MPHIPIPRSAPILHKTETMTTADPQLLTLADGSRLLTFAGGTTEDGTFIQRYYGQFLDADSQPQGAFFAMGDQVMGRTNRMDMGALDDGGFAIAWGPRENIFQHFVRSFDADGTPRSEPLLLEGLGGDWISGWVNVDALPESGFMVTWTGQLGGGWNQATRTAIFNQRFDDLGMPISTPLQVTELNELSAFGNMGGITGPSSAAVLEDGSSVIVWHAFNNQAEVPFRGLFGRMLDDAGLPAGEAFKIADVARPVGTGRGDEILALPDGGFAVLWHHPVDFDTVNNAGEPVTVDGVAVMMQRYQSDGTPVGEMRQISQTDWRYAWDPAGTVLPGGDIALVWDTETVFGFTIDASWFQRLDGDFNPLAPPVRIAPGEPVGDGGAARGSLTLDSDADGAATLAWHRIVAVGEAGVFTQALLPQVLGTEAADDLQAPDTGVSVHGLAGDDTLTGGPGDDFLTGGPGDDLLLGGGGVNTAVFSGAIGDYDIARGADGRLTVTDLREGSPDGTDTLESIAQLHFTGGWTPETIQVADLTLDATMTGQVTGPQGLPMAGVMLTLSAEGWPDQTASTDAEGGFAFNLGEGVAGRLDATQAYDPATHGPITAGDALDTLRIAVGLQPSFGPAQAQNYIAADINGDGQVTAGDALDILRVAVGLEAEHAPRWVFIDSATDWGSVVQGGRIDYQPGIAFDALSGEVDLAMTGILIGSLTEVV